MSGVAATSRNATAIERMMHEIFGRNHLYESSPELAAQH